MNVLVVDDQSNVVQGILNGINWKEINIEKVYSAYHAQEAREIIERKAIDIMLCDIEMPGENGLELFQWIREQGYPIECIFLTAHADFEFAKEAVKLGGFDYILQPARYEEIKNGILSAKQKICTDIQLKKYSAYGKIMYEQKEMLLNNIIKNWISGTEDSHEEVIKSLQQFSVPIAKGDLIYYILIQKLKQIGKGKQLEENLRRYVMWNILTELFMPCALNVLLSDAGEGDYGLILYPEELEILPEPDAVQKILDDFIIKSRQFLALETACYGRNATSAEKVPEINKLLREWKNDNVAQESRIFWGGNSKHSKPKVKLPEEMKYWQYGLAGGSPQNVKNEAYAYLDEVNMDAESLKIFYHSFLRILANALEQTGISNYQIFQDKESMHKSLTAYKSLNSMKELIDYVTAFFTRLQEKEDVNYVEIVTQYIHCNIEKDIRRTEIASTVNLNEDYLSRIFKKEKGVSLKEFILQEKMQVAQVLLRTTSFSVGTIAMKVGFSNFSHFSQMYRKTMGVNPAEERK